MKYFQFGAIFCYSNDMFQFINLLPNYIDTKDFNKYLEDYTRTEWFKNQSAEWQHKNVIFHEEITTEGKCFSANFANNIFRHEV